MSPTPTTLPVAYKSEELGKGPLTSFSSVRRAYFEYVVLTKMPAAPRARRTAIALTVRAFRKYPVSWLLAERPRRGRAGLAGSFIRTGKVKGLETNTVQSLDARQLARLLPALVNRFQLFPDIVVVRLPVWQMTSGDLQVFNA